MPEASEALEFLGALEVMRCVLCLLEVMHRVLLWMLEAPEVMRFVLLCMLRRALGQLRGFAISIAAR